jgi:hypothetical protein
MFFTSYTEKSQVRILLTTFMTTVLRLQNNQKFRMIFSSSIITTSGNITSDVTQD